MYIALRYIKFDREYSPGERIEDSQVLGTVSQMLIENGYLSYVPNPNEINIPVKEDKNKIINETEEVVANGTTDVVEEKNEEEINERDGFTREALSKMTNAKLEELLSINNIEFEKGSRKEILVDTFLKG